MHFTITDPANPHESVYDGAEPARALIPGTYPGTWTDADGTEHTGTVTITAKVKVRGDEYERTLHTTTQEA